VKRKRPPMLKRVATGIHDTSTTSNDEPTSIDDITDGATDPKRVRTEYVPELQRSKFNSYYGKDAINARAEREREALLAVWTILEELADWQRQADKQLEGSRQGQKALEQLHEYREGEATKLSESVANLLEATVINNARLEQDRGRQDSYKAQADTDRVAVKDLTTRVEKHEENVAVQLQCRPTSKALDDLMLGERKARDDAIEQCTQRLSATMSASLKTTIANELISVMDRIKAIDKSLNGHRKQSDARIPKMEEAIKRCNDQSTETATSLFALQAQYKQTASTEYVQEHLATERKAREKALSELPGKWTVSTSTLINARTAVLESTFREAIIPRALEPLQDEVNTLSESCRHDSERFKAWATEVQHKSHADYDRTVKETQSKIDALKAFFTKETGRQDQLINGLRQDLSVERQRRAELEKTVSQAAVSHAEDKKELLMAMEAQKDDFTTQLKEKGKAHAAELDGMIRGLRAELLAAIKNIDEQAKEVEDLRRRLIKAEADISQESKTHKANIIDIRQELETLTKPFENLSNAVDNISESHSQFEKALSSDFSHLRTELHAEQTKTVAREAVQAECVENLKKLEDTTNATTVRIDSLYNTIKTKDLHVVNERLSKLESLGPEGPQHQTASTEKTQNHLDYLTSRVNTLQKSVEECVYTVKATSTDIDLLKRQHADQVVNCEAKIQGQADAVKAQVNAIARQLRARVENHFALQDHLFGGHVLVDSPRLLELQASMREITCIGQQDLSSQEPDNTQMWNRLAALEARVDKLVTADEVWDIDNLPLLLTTWSGRICSRFDECKKGVAEDMTELSARLKNLEVICRKHGRDFGNLDAQLNILRGNLQAKGF
jgi:DNA repair exonuclease SbcCD ATPase subunit